MRIISIDHIGIAVNSIPESMDFYGRGLNLKLGGTEAIPDRHLKIGFIDVGNTRVELIESTSNDSAIAKYVQKHGGGIHHICLRVANLDEALAHMKKEGFELIDEKPKPGAEGSRVAFVHPKAGHGVMIELKEIP
jgi:methylmalonyl-CoA/ethylmalonyl-CoA epimerase